MSLYKQLPDDLLAGFYVEVGRNIEKGILVETMHSELALIKAAAHLRSLSSADLREIYRTEILPLMGSK